jgi:hypothetical protein
MNLTKEDYINILNYYNIKINSNTSLSSIKKMAEKIIAKKLCSCIKKVPNPSKKESRAIGICNHSVLQRKHLKINGFSCKKRMMLKTSKTNKNKLTKTISSKLLLNKKQTLKHKNNIKALH